MAGTVNYAYDPNQDVYVIHTCDDDNNRPQLYVIGGTVIRIRAEVLVTETKLYYDVRLDRSSGTDEFLETDVFTDKATAIADYDTRIA